MIRSSLIQSLRLSQQPFLLSPLKGFQVVILRHRLQLKLSHRLGLKLSRSGQLQPTSLSHRLLPLGARPLPLDSLHEDRQALSGFFRQRNLLISQVARSELLDLNWVAGFCGLERGETEDQRRSMGMKHSFYHDPSRTTINLALPWHSSVEEIADCNFNIVTGKLNKGMKSLNPARPWGPKDFFLGIGYHTHNLEG